MNEGELMMLVWPKKKNTGCQPKKGVKACRKAGLATFNLDFEYNLPTY
jgi:hypothetical protein